MKLANGYTLKVIPYGKESPMVDHLGGEIAADDEAMTFYAHEVFVVTYGMDSIVKACLSYPA